MQEGIYEAKRSCRFAIPEIVMPKLLILNDTDTEASRLAAAAFTPSIPEVHGDVCRQASVSPQQPLDLTLVHAMSIPNASNKQFCFVSGGVDCLFPSVAYKVGTTSKIVR